MGKRKKHWRHKKRRSLKIKNSAIYVALILIVAYTYSQSVHFYGMSFIYGFNPLIFWIVVGIICFYVYKNVK